VGDPTAELDVLVGTAEEVDDLLQLRLGLVDAGDVLEGDHDLLGIDPTRLRATEVAEEAEPPARDARRRTR
jgi:hypothetical protein